MRLRRARGERGRGEEMVRLRDEQRVCEKDSEIGSQSKGHKDDGVRTYLIIRNTAALKYGFALFMSFLLTSRISIARSGCASLSSSSREMSPSPSVSRALRIAIRSGIDVPAGMI